MYSRAPVCSWMGPHATRVCGVWLCVCASTGVPSHGVRSSTARPSHMMASMLTLDTLREEETLAEDLAAKPLTPARAPATHAGRGLGRGALSDGTLDALPSDLPDPVAHLVAASEMQGPGAAGTGEGTAVRSPTSLPLAAAASTGTATKAAPADAAAISLKVWEAAPPWLLLICTANDWLAALII